MNKEQTKEYYRAAAHKLTVTPRMHEIINEVYKYMYGKTVLDVGCGNRIITTFMSLHNDVTGIDIDEDIYKYKIDKKFDVICLFDVLEHLKHKATALNICNNSLLPGGQLWVNLPEQEDPGQPYDSLFTFDRLYDYLKRINFKLLSLRWYQISRSESYNLMIFRKL